MKYLSPILLIVLGCHSFTEPTQRGSLEEIILPVVDSTRLPPNLHSRKSLKHFYTLRENSLFWSIHSQLTPSADSLLDFIENANRFGLNPADYHMDALRHLLKDTLSPDYFSSVDVFLTDAYLTIYCHMKYGRLDPKTLQRLNFSDSVNEEAIASLNEIHEGSVVGKLMALEPRWSPYQDLKKVLQDYAHRGNDDAGQLANALKISLNMERWRWRKKMPDRYVSVNIPAFTMRVYEHDSLWLETRVIVGKRETPTPVMESVIRSFIIYPYWHVPNSISTKEILPHLQVDASYLRRNNFDVLNQDGTVILSDTIQWDYYTREYFPFILRQREGFENSMGIIKFNFANNYGVYLHDTNSKRLFEHAKRDLSHGCVRVKNAVSFAHYLVREDDIYVSPDDLDQYLSLQQRLKIDLRKPITLALEYFTAEVRNGVPLFYEDIYKKDSLMMQFLYPSLVDATTASAAAGL